MKQEPIASRRRAVVAAAAAALALVAGAPVAAADFPARDVRLVVPFSAGGGADLYARRLAGYLDKRWPHTIVVDNVPGAGGSVAAGQVAKAKPDGYTLFFATHPILAVNPFLYNNLTFDPAKDFASVAQISATPGILLVPRTGGPATVSELVAMARAKPGELRFGSGGIGTSLHLAGELFKAAADIDIRHIPYKGSAPALTALVGGEVNMMFDSSASAIRHIGNGRVRGLALAAMKRVPALPDVPTFDESGLKGFTSILGHGLLVPAGTPKDVISAINRDVNKVIADPEYRKHMDGLGVELVGGDPARFSEFIAAERERWGKLIPKLGLKKR